MGLASRGQRRFHRDVSVEKGEGLLSVEALDPQGNFRNFLNLQAIVGAPRRTADGQLEQTGPEPLRNKFPHPRSGLLPGPAHGSERRSSPRLASCRSERELFTRVQCDRAESESSSKNVESGGAKCWTRRIRWTIPSCTTARKRFSRATFGNGAAPGHHSLPLDVGIRRIQLIARNG